MVAQSCPSLLRRIWGRMEKWHGGPRREDRCSARAHAAAPRGIPPSTTTDPTS